MKVFTVSTSSVLAVALVICLQAAPPIAAPKPAPAPLPECWLPATVVRWVDVDTAYLKIRVPFAGITIDGPDGKGFKSRIQGFDGYESSRARIQREPFKSFTAAQWLEETTKGKAATAAVAELAKDKQAYVRAYDGPQQAVYGRDSVWLKFRDKDGAETRVDVWAKQNGHDRGGNAEDDE